MFAICYMRPFEGESCLACSARQHKSYLAKNDVVQSFLALDGQIARSEVQPRLFKSVAGARRAASAVASRHGSGGRYETGFDGMHAHVVLLSASNGFAAAKELLSTVDGRGFVNSKWINRA